MLSDKHIEHFRVERHCVVFFTISRHFRQKLSYCENESTGALFMRLPSYILCLTLVLLIKLLERNEFSYASLCLIITAYVLSIYLVIIRFHQSVLADTKKLCSELYSKHKMKLFCAIVNEYI